jgi:ribosomal protein L1
MSKVGKITQQIRKSVDSSIMYTPLDGIKKIREMLHLRKCTQSISIDIGLKSKKKQELPNNYTFNVPYGIKRSARILVITGIVAGEKLKADNKYNDSNSDCFVKIGTIEDIKQIVRDGKTTFTQIVTNKENLISIAAYAKDLAGLRVMPSAKNGTVVEDVWAGVKGIIEGSKITAKKDAGKHLRFKIASADAKNEEIAENIQAICQDLMVVVKSFDCINGIRISTTHGPSVSLNTNLLCKTSSRI